MRIVRIELRRLSLPLRLPISHAAATRRLAEPLIVTLTSANGTHGYGEVIPRSYLTGESVESCAADLETRFWPRLKALTFSPDQAPWDTLRPLYEDADKAGKTAAWSGMDIAVHDLWARECRIPGARLFGGGSGSACPMSAVITAGIPAWAAAKLYLSLGFREFKVKAGDPRDVKRLAAVRRAIGPNIPIRIDVNGAWTTQGDAEAAWSRLKEFSPSLVEQPLPRADLAGNAQFQRSTGVPVMADESLCSLADAKALAAVGGVAFWNIRLAKVGGFSGARRLVEEARRAGVRWQLGALVGETSLAGAATRVALALGSPAHFESSFAGALLVDDPFRRTGEPRCPADVTPLDTNALGLGVEPNQKILARRTTWVRSCR